MMSKGQMPPQRMMSMVGSFDVFMRISSMTTCNALKIWDVMTRAIPVIDCVNDPSKTVAVEILAKLANVIPSKQHPTPTHLKAGISLPRSVMEKSAVKTMPELRKTRETLAGTYRRPAHKQPVDNTLRNAGAAANATVIAYDPLGGFDVPLQVAQSLRERSDTKTWRSTFPTSPATAIPMNFASVASQGRRNCIGLPRASVLHIEYNALTTSVFAAPLTKMLSIIATAAMVAIRWFRLRRR
eukprot:CAMPEP_0115756784 /NCGR_PEP_ID=MMETSP0272-20121206/98099_1 /TAXON_ID=71861 /ORGANISM="Scrippsiella trochoidea, Strain CCMP3099" /LENGTH=240 /DNA_ID=CAMNT_0003202303 /DNA_START=375 /DNA_END=1093 /DNA_ORIENTATION=-